MIRVTVELHSAISKSRSRTLCTMQISNDGTGTTSMGSYDVALFGKNGYRMWQGKVSYRRKAQHTFQLIANALKAAGYTL